MKRAWIFALVIWTRIRRARTFPCSLPDSSAPRSSSVLSLSSIDVETNELEHERLEENDRAERYTRFAGVGRLYADHGIAHDDNSQDPHVAIVDRLNESNVAVIGLGGVGSWAAEALCRSGVGNLILIDLDDICISNTNRQLHTTVSSIGRLKTDAMKERLVGINPECNVTSIHDFVMADNVHELINRMKPELDVCLDCIDGAKEKTALLAACAELGVPVVTCGGAAGKMDPTKVVVDDLTRVTFDPLLARCRKNLRKEHGFGRGFSYHDQTENNIRPRKWHISSVFSTETPKQPQNPQKAKDVSSLRRCDGAFGTASFVTGTFGFVAAAEVVGMLVKGRPPKPRKNCER